MILPQAGLGFTNSEKIEMMLKILDLFWNIFSKRIIGNIKN